MFERFKNKLFPPKVKEKPELRTSTAVMTDFFSGDYNEDDQVDTNLLKEGGENAVVIPSTSGAAWASHIPDPVKASTEVLDERVENKRFSDILETHEEPQKRNKPGKQQEEPKSSWDLLDIGDGS